MAQPWDQLPEESSAAYARFLAYRNLGPARTVRSAYRAASAQNRKKKYTSGQWSKESAAHRWADRAEAWDVANLAEAGRRAAVRFVALIEAMALRGLEALTSGSLRPDTWQQLLDTAHALGGLVSADAIRELQRDSGDGPPAPECGPQPARAVA
jgi:hypothetical protein